MRSLPKGLRAGQSEMITTALQTFNDGQWIYADREHTQLIGVYAFAANMTIPSSVVSLPSRLITGQSGSSTLNSLIINSDCNIPDNFINNAYNLLEVTINGRVRKIGQYAIIGNRVLRALILPESLETIDSWAFMSNNIRELEVPSSVTAIGIDAFKNIDTVFYDGPATGSPWGAGSVQIPLTPTP